MPHLLQTGNQVPGQLVAIRSLRIVFPGPHEVGRRILVILHVLEIDSPYEIVDRAALVRREVIPVQNGLVLLDRRTVQFAVTQFAGQLLALVDRHPAAIAVAGTHRDRQHQQGRREA